jgi:hypothetical protein
VHCFGDSHATVFRQIQEQRLLPATSFDVTMIGGATALGLANPNSQTQALPQFAAVISGLPPDRPLLFILGEVDCGFVIWYRAQTKGVSIQDELERSIRNYMRFIEEVRSGGHEHVIVAAAPPPTILEGQDWGEVANLRREVTASLRDRTSLTIEYNARLRAWTGAHGCAFVDYEREVLDEETGVVAETYRNPDALDHHLAPDVFAPLVAEKLRALGFD